MITLKNPFRRKFINNRKLAKCRDYKQILDAYTKEISRKIFDVNGEHKLKSNFIRASAGAGFAKPEKISYPYLINIYIPERFKTIFSETGYEVYLEEKVNNFKSLLSKRLDIEIPVSNTNTKVFFADKKETDRIEFFINDSYAPILTKKFDPNIPVNQNLKKISFTHKFRGKINSYDLEPERIVIGRLKNNTGIVPKGSLLLTTNVVDGWYQACQDSGLDSSIKNYLHIEAILDSDQATFLSRLQLLLEAGNNNNLTIKNLAKSIKVIKSGIERTLNTNDSLELKPGDIFYPHPHNEEHQIIFNGYKNNKKDYLIKITAFETGKQKAEKVLIRKSLIIKNSNADISLNTLFTGKLRRNINMEVSVSESSANNSETINLKNQGDLVLISQGKSSPLFLENGDTFSANETRTGIMIDSGLHFEINVKLI